MNFSLNELNVAEQNQKEGVKKVMTLSLKEVILFMWSKRIKLILVSTSFLIFGVVIAMTTPKEWSASTQLLPESEGNNGRPSNSSLKGLVGLAGIDLTSGGQTSLNPLLYSEIIGSYDFSEAILNERMYFSGVKDSIILKEYFTEYWETALSKKAIRLPFKLASGFIMLFQSSPRSSEGDSLLISDEKRTIVSWTKLDEDLHKLVQSHVFLGVGETNGLITIASSFQDPEASAQIVEFTKEYLIDYVSDYNTQKQLKNLEFLNTQIEKADSVYKNKKSQLADFQDNNISISTASGRVRLDFLQYEADLAFNLYSQLASKLQEAELILEENKSVFTVLKPTLLPLEYSKPNKIAIVILSGLLGLILGCIWFFYKTFIHL